MTWDGEDDRRSERPRRENDRALFEWRLKQVERLAELNAHAIDAVERILSELPQMYLPREDEAQSRKTKRETIALYFVGVSSFCSFVGTAVLVITRVH